MIVSFQAQLDPEIVAELSRDKKVKTEFTREELQEIKGYFYEFCSKIEKYGYTRADFYVNGEKA